MQPRAVTVPARRGFPVTADPDPYDAPLSALRNHVDDLGVWLGIWCNRSEPDAHARRCASDAVDAMLRELHLVRRQLIGEIRDSDDVSAARADALLARAHEGREHT
jgi:hypothetical protein